MQPEPQGLTTRGKMILIIPLLIVLIGCGIASYLLFFNKEEPVTNVQSTVAAVQQQPGVQPPTPVIQPTRASNSTGQTQSQTGQNPSPTAVQETQQTQQPAANDLPTYTVGFDTFAPYFIQTLLMKELRLDQANGFNLELVPFYSVEGTEFTEADRTAMMASGEWDGLLTTLDKAVKSPEIGQVTGLIDETDGLDALVCRDGINSYNDLRGKKIGVFTETVGEFFLYYILNSVSIPASEVTVVYYDALTTDGEIIGAVDEFNAGKLDCVSGWEPDILAALPPESRGHLVTNSHLHRAPIDVLVTSHQAINNTPELVGAYHNAWCSTLKFALEDPRTAEQLIIQWGESQNLTWWTYVANESDWLQVMAKSALATCQDNAEVFSLTNNPDNPLTQRMVYFNQVWQAAGLPSSNLDVYGYNDLINQSFMLAAAQANPTSAEPINKSFSMLGDIDVQAFDPSTMGIQVVLAELPFEKIGFQPNSTILSESGMSDLDNYVIPLLKASPYVYLRLFGSAAFPNGERYSENGVLTTAQGRAEAIARYIIETGGVDQDRVIVEWIMPPFNRCQSEAECAEQRRVDFELISVGY